MLLISRIAAFGAFFVLPHSFSIHLYPSAAMTTLLLRIVAVIIPETTAMPFQAPNPTQNVHRCNDWREFGYTNPCSDINNFVANFAPNSKHPNRFPGDFAKQNCQGAHRRAHTVCRYCVAALEDQQWFKRAWANFTKKPQDRSVLSRASSSYLTRLCRLCEKREERLLNQFLRVPNNGVALQAHTLQQQARMVNWPYNRCICARWLWQGTKCRLHRKDDWDAIRHDGQPAQQGQAQVPAQLEELADNREFLESITLAGPNQTVVTTRDERALRKQLGFERACRCGADPVPLFSQASVLQCMCCEGIVHVPAQNQPPGPFHTRQQLRDNSVTAPNLFGFGRPIGPTLRVDAGPKDRAYWNNALR